MQTAMPGRSLKKEKSAFISFSSYVDINLKEITKFNNLFQKISKLYFL